MFAALFFLELRDANNNKEEAMMICSATTVFGNSVTAIDVLLQGEFLRRANLSCFSMTTGRLGCSSYPLCASSAEAKRKNSTTVRAFPFIVSGLPSSLRSFLFESDYTREINLVEASEESEEEEETDKEEPEGKKRANWVVRLMELRKQWPGRQRDDDNTGLFEEDDEEAQVGREDDHVCGARYEDDVSFDRESFSNFLAEVPLEQTILFSKLALLCNMAYSIPGIKADEMNDYYGLNFVTSSLEKKAEAAAAAQAHINRDFVSIRGSCTNRPDSQAPTESGRKRRPITSRASAAYQIAASAASYVRSRASGLLPLGLSQAHQIGGPNLEMGLKRDILPKVHESKVAVYAATSTITAVVVAEEAARTEAARDLRSPHNPPCEWFVCDDPATSTRCFVIQGSDSLASWIANLLFEPTSFEGTEVQVHRGIYEAAKGLYEQFMPEIRHHLDVHGAKAKLRFTGHSLGGSLSLLVSLMLLTREVVPPSALLPVVAFGSPSVFCGADHILEDLGLDEDHFCSVMMHRDIVPRAFSCDYPARIAQLLKRVNRSFRSLPCLNRNKLLYAPVGKLYIVQPEERVSPCHPFLPPGCALYVMEKSNKEGLMGAMTAFLSSPHPLETLSDLRAYGSEGTILRDHESSNYLMAINAVLRKQSMPMFKRRSHWLPSFAGYPRETRFKEGGCLEDASFVN